MSCLLGPFESSMEPSTEKLEIVLKGWLNKKGKLNTAMKPRYFVLATNNSPLQGVLLYFEAPFKVFLCKFSSRFYVVVRVISPQNGVNGACLLRSEQLSSCVLLILILMSWKCLNKMVRDFFFPV